MTSDDIHALAESEAANGHDGCEMDCQKRRALELARAFLALRSAVRALETFYVTDGIGKDCARGIDDVFRKILSE